MIFFFQPREIQNMRQTDFRNTFREKRSPLRRLFEKKSLYMKQVKGRRLFSSSLFTFGICRALSGILSEN